MKLVFGEYDLITTAMVYDNEWVILNFNSLKEGFERLNLIIPFNVLNPSQEVYEKEYDIMYANYIMNNDIAFMELMKVIMSLYMGKNVYIISSSYSIHDYISESLQKFLQSRYGLVSYIVNTSEDLEYVEESNFNIYGVANLDTDKERFTYICASANPDILKTE